MTSKQEIIINKKKISGQLSLVNNRKIQKINIIF